MVQGWTHEPRRTAESLPRISLLGMPNEESLVSQITESKIAYSQVNLSPSPSITEQARLPCKEMELSPDEHLQHRRPGLGRSPAEGNGYPLQYSGLENSMDYSMGSQRVGHD